MTAPRRRTVGRAAARPARRSARDFPVALDLGVFRQMADMTSEAFYLTDEDGRFLYVNDRALHRRGILARGAAAEDRLAT